MNRVKIWLFILLFLQLTSPVRSQCSIDTGFSCLVNCFDLNALIPDVRGTDDYTVRSIPYCPYDFITNISPISINCTSQDDKFADTTFLPFQFCFYGQNYSKLIISTNGYITFDTTMALRGSNYNLTGNPLPFAGTGTQGTGTNCPTPNGSPYYPRASIFSAFADIFPRPTDNYKIEARVFGVAPSRKFIISFVNISMFSCVSEKYTSQIVLHEGTGIIDIHIESKPTCFASNGNRAIVGIQNWARDLGIAAPGRNCESFTANLESWRFTPNAGPQRFNRVELYKNNVLVNTGTAVPIGNSQMRATFTNVCQTETNATYIVKAIYEDCKGTLEEPDFQTQINVNKTAGPITATTTPAGCANATGTITITDPVGPTLEYSIDGFTWQASPIFNVNPGNYTIRARIIASNCLSTRDVVVSTLATLSATASTTPASCGGNNGSITVTATGGNTPYTYSINGGPFVTSNVFTNLAGNANYNVQVKDATNCTFSFSIIVSSTAGFTATATTTNANCAGSATGTITVTPASGTAPYTYVLDGGTPQSSNVFSAVTPGNHTILITDATGCSFTLNATVNGGSGITASATATNANCPGSPTGSLTITPASGTAPYTYTLNGGASQSSNIFSNLIPGNYTIVVTDAGGCTFSFTALVNAGSGITASATSTNANCPGSPTGSITVNSVSGVAPYTYTLNGGAPQSSNVFPNLVAGSYTIVVTDAGGCTFTLLSTVNGGTGITASATTTNSSCAGSPTGSITITPSAGTAPYSYTMNGGASQSSNVFSNLTAGSYAIVVTDAAGCSFSFTATVNSGSGITATAATTTATCAGSATGSITITASAGTAPYSYTLNGGAPQTSNVYSNLIAGAYTIVVTDAAGCSFSFTATVSNGTGITATASSTNTNCPGSSTGSITITASSGNAPYTYSLNGGAPQASNTFTGLAAGSYTILVRDVNNCSFSFSTAVSNGAGITATATTGNTNCPGSASGTATVTPSGGTGPFTYSIDGGGFQSSNIFTGLSAGIHNIIVRDAGNCSFSLSVTVSDGTGITATVTTSNAACAGSSSGSITVTAPSGIAPHTYSLNGAPYVSSATFINLPAANYVVSVRDANGCIVSIPAVVGNNPGVTATLVKTDAGCPGSSTGSITVNASAGSAPYSYQLNGGTAQSSNVFLNLLAANYTVRVTDAGGCFYETTQTINALPAIGAQLNIIQPGCFGQSNGSITITPVNGTAPFQYALNAGAFQAGNVFNALAIGTYTIHIRDVLGCTKDSVVTLIQPPLLTATATSTQASCSGLPDGAINISVNGGTTPYAYSIDNGTTFQTVNPVPANVGSFNIVVRDSRGCTVNTSATVTLLDTMRLELGNDTTVCFGAPLTLQPATNPGTNGFAWTPAGSGLSSTIIKNPVARPADTVKYYLTATWGLCQRRDSIIVNVLRRPVANAGLDTIICDRTFALLQGSASNLSGAVDFLWSPATEVAPVNNPSAVARPINTGANTYILEVSDRYGCNFKVYDSVTITMNPQPPANAGNDTIAAIGVLHQLNATGGLTYAWLPVAPLNDASIPNPVARLFTDTRFTLIVVDDGGCIGYDTINIKVYEGPTYYIPTAFTPNGDGLNDIFRPTLPAIEKTEYFRVFNRWGQLIFSSNQNRQGWDGTFKGKEQPLGAYAWVIRGVDKFGRVVEKKGTVALLR